MAGPPFGAPLQAFGAGDGGRLPNSINYNRAGNSGNFGSASEYLQDDFYDPELDCLLSSIQLQDQQNSAACWNGIHSNVNSAFSSTPAQTVCNLQPRVYKRSPSLTHTYRPPPFANYKVVELQNLPPNHTTLADPIIFTSSMPPQPLSYADMAALISTPTSMALHPPPSHINMPSHQQSAIPPVYFNPSTQQSLGAYHPNIDFTFDSPQIFNSTIFPDVQGKAAVAVPAPWQDTPSMEVNQISFDQGPEHSKLAGPHIIGYSQQQNFMNSGPLCNLDVCTRHPTSCPASVAASPTYNMQSSYINGAGSDFAAMKISSISTPTSTSSGFYQTHSKKRTLSVPPSSPTSSVNKNITHESTVHEYMRTSSHYGDRVAFKVKTELLNLHDGFTWKKYGAKAIKKTKHPRSYFKCDKIRSGCNVVKNTQRCADEEYVLFTYFGRHNHDP